MPNLQYYNGTTWVPIPGVQGAAGTFSGDASTITTGVVPVLYGGTGASTASGALTNLDAYSVSNYYGHTYQSSTIYDIISRSAVNSSTGAIGNGFARMTLFTPHRNITATQLNTWCGTAPSDTSTAKNRQMGLFTVTATQFVPLAVSAGSSTLFDTGSAISTAAISTTTLTAGTTYAFGVLAYGSSGGTYTSGPQLAAMANSNANTAGLFTLSPAISYVGSVSISSFALGTPLNISNFTSTNTVLWGRIT